MTSEPEPGSPDGVRPPSVSVVLATYNGARYLQEQLQSLAAQRRRPDELVVSDDGSSDGTVALLEQFAASAPFRVTVHRQDTNLGPDQNFAAAAALATGDLLFFCDQDDRWDADKLAVMSDALRTDPRVGLVMCDGRLVDDTLRPTGSTIWSTFGFDAAPQDRVESDDAFAVFARSMPVYGCTIGVRRDLARWFAPIPPGVSFDSWIGQIVSVVAPVRLVRRPLLDYRQHASQVTGFDAGSRFRRLRLQVARSDVRTVRAEAARLDATLRRLSTLPAGPARDRAEAVTRSRLRLVRRRLRARESYLLRVPLIAGGVVRGEYRDGAQGLRSAAIDLLARRT